MYNNHGYSPLISKIRVHNPNKKGSSQANRNYVTYIATREGVSLESVKGINDLLHEEGMMDKELQENIVHQEAGNKEYVEYMAKRPRSQGLFGNIDTSDLKAVSSEIASLTTSGRIIYRGIISLSEKDGEEKGFRNINAWNNYLTKTMPNIAKELGISSCNHTWVAAFHAEEKHPHVHYMLWENQDKVRSPYIHKATQQKIRIYLQNEMFDDAYSRAVDNVIRQEHNELNAARNKERKIMLDGVKSLMQDISYVPGVEYERLPSRATNEYLEQIAKETQKLVNMLPGQGSFKYKYMPNEVKIQLDKLIDIVLEKDDIKKAYDTYLQHVARDGKLHGQSKSQIEARIGKTIRTELRPRIANKILDEIKKEIVPVPEIKESYKQYEVHESKVENKRGINDTLLKKQQNDIMPIYKKDIVPVIQEKLEMLESSELETLEDDERFITHYFVEWNKEYKNAMQLIYGEKPEFEKAFEILEKEGMKGNALAINEVGKLIEHQLIDIPIFEAHEYYKEAIAAFINIHNTVDNRNGSIFTQKAIDTEWVKSYSAYRVGKLYNFTKDIDEKQLEKAAEWYSKAGSNKYAQYSLAKLYLSGDVYVSENKDICENRKLAIGLLESSAEQGNPYADYLLATLYEKDALVEAEPYYANAFKGFLSMAADTKDDSLLYRIGSMYLSGKGTQPNKEAGIVYIKKSADLGNENAKLKLASIYLDENNDELNKLAFDILNEMAEKNHPMAEYKLGCIYADEEHPKYDIHKAIDYFEKSANQDNEYAQYKLGCIYANKESPEYDIKKALDYLLKAAEQGNEYAQYKLGCIYVDEEHSAYNMQKAIYYFEKAAAQNNEYAQYKLGCIYADKESPEYNMEKALDYLLKAAEQNNEYAQYKLGSIYADKESPEYNMEKALDYLLKAAEQGNEYAQYKLGSIYADKESPEYNMEKALDYLLKAAEQGNEYAQYKLGCIYADEEHSAYNVQKAIYYFEKAAAQNNEYAQYKLGCIYANKELPAYDIDRAIKYFTDSAQQGNRFSQCRLGCIYYFGKGVPEDKELGRYWLQRAADQGDEFADKVLNNTIGIDFSYCLLKGVLSSLEAYNRQAAYVNNEYLAHTNSKQAAIEKNKHRDNEMDTEFS